MSAAAIAHENLTDDDDATSVTVAGAITLAPASNLANPHVGKVTRVNDDSTFISVDLGSAVSVGAVMLARVSGVDPDFRVRGSLVSVGGTDVFDSATISGLPYFDPDYGLFVYVLPSHATVRYLRIDVSEVSVDYIEMGRLFVGPYDQFTNNYAPGWTRSPVRRSVDTIGLGGQTFPDLRQGYWRTSAQFAFVTAAERANFLEEIFTAIVNNGHKDMLWIGDPASDNLSRDCIWGYFEGDPVLAEQQILNPRHYEVSFSLRQRL